MTEHFQKMVSRLTRANNFMGGRFVLLTQLPDEDKPSAHLKGMNTDVHLLLCGGIRAVLMDAPDKDAENIRECLKKIIIEDEQRRFQNKPIGQ